MLPSKNREECNICLIVTFATFAILALCFVTSWFVSLLNLLEVSGSIFSDFNVSFDFPLIRVAIALNTRKTDH